MVGLQSNWEVKEGKIIRENAEKNHLRRSRVAGEEVACPLPGNLS